MQILVSGVVGRPTLCLSFPENEVLVSEIKREILVREGFPVCDQRLSVGCRDLSDHEILHESGDVFVRFNLRLLGGKGGFGALLRGQGGGHKTTNFDDCRDLNGRRLRHLKNEMKLAEWYAEQKALELEKKNKKRNYEPPKHDWDATQFMERTKELEASVVGAVEAGLLQAKKKKKLSAAAAPVAPAAAADQLASAVSADGELASSSSSSAAVLPPTASADRPDSSDSDSDSDSDSSSDEEKEVLLNLDLFGTAEELEALGMDELKFQLQTRGLKCGGTLKERASRLFSIKGKTPDQVDPKIRAAPPKK